ncbi:WD40-repeat-containing domain protein [Radiomyces spectabilis]|uniref:WD40-repeat-containing domain protein n=1 Tax=Radiomyces spectabilis TaxID=64574 RepID=UPI002220FC82|nr:WD40-repeat-containing domain protein [Radiomyces spectabilis]KAI8369384.1 WD40-repeat-containing domain protein [Radiomyces spectabilis]
MVASTLKRPLSDDTVDKESKKSMTEKPNDAMDADLPRDQRQERVFANMRLRRIVKENHGSDIRQLSFFFNSKNFSAPVGIDHNKTFDKRGAVQRDQTDTSNILATVGGCQLNVYDNEHCGDHLDIMSNFDLAAVPQEDEQLPKRNLNTFCWLYREGDAWLAAAGADASIHIISLANSQEIDVLHGHSKMIHDLQSNPRNDDHILSTSKDGTIRLWDVNTRRCLVIFEADATVACFHPSGTKFISGGARGELREWTIPAHMAAQDMDEEPLTVEKRHSRLLKKMHGDSYIDCIRYANGNVLTKSINGRMEYWDVDSEKVTQSLLTVTCFISLL